MPEQPPDREPYQLEPEEQPAPRPEPKPRIEAAPLLENFEEDADFSRDPEVQAALAAKPPAPEPAVRLAPEPLPFVKTGLGDARVWGIAGAALLLGAMIATGITARSHPIASILLALYSVALHTGTGVVAVYVAAMFAERRVSHVELVAARMLAAVAAFSLLFHLDINPFGERVATWKAEETVLGALAYLAVVAGTFRFPRVHLAYVVGSHFGLWVVVQVGQELSKYVAAVPAPAGTP